jgi:hypothetical protein
VSDGNTGAFVYTMSEYGIAANKAYVFFDQGMVALGNSIQQSSPNGAEGVVGTNLNQTNLNGPVTYADASHRIATLPAGQKVHPDGLNWVHHNGVGYVFFKPESNALLSTHRQSGSWQSINNAGSREMVFKDIFALDVLHGPRPKDGVYAYAVLPNATAADTDAAAKKMPFAVLRNDAIAQAVQVGSRTQAIFHANGTIALARGIELTKAGRDTGVAVIWDASPSTVTLSLANTDRRGGPIVLTINQRLDGESAAYDARTGLTTISVTPPDGHRAGSTVRLTFDLSPVAAN